MEETASSSGSGLCSMDRLLDEQQQQIEEDFFLCVPEILIIMF